MKKNLILQLRNKFQFCESQDSQIREIYRKIFIKFDDMLRSSKREIFEERNKFEEQQYINNCCKILKMSKKELAQATDWLWWCL